MGDRSDAETSNTIRVSDEDQDATIEINIKTLDSRIFSFRVKKNNTVLMLKEKIADVIGTPVGQQRLIFKGRVLKDEHLLSYYQADDGHTFHLVARQPVQSETPSVTSSAGASENAENPGAGPPGSNPWSGVVGAVSHNVVIRPINLDDQTGNIVPDVTRIIGSVLSSLGLGSPTVSAASVDDTAPSTVPNSSSQPPQTGALNATSSENISLNSGHVFPLSVTNQDAMATTDALATLLLYMSRMQQTFASLGYQAQAPNEEDSARLGSISVAGLPTPERLGDVLMAAFHLLNGQGASSLYDIASQLHRHQSCTNPALRAGVQHRATNVGVAMQHLGAMLLELSRAILTLRMGPSPASATVNPGPPLYVSAAGPSPIMVQPPMHSVPFGLGNYPGQVRTGGIIHDLSIRVQSGIPVGPTEESTPAQGQPNPPTQGQPTPPTQGQPTPPTQGSGSEETETRTHSAVTPSASPEHKTDDSAQLPADSSSTPEGPVPSNVPGSSAEGAKVTEKKPVPLGLGLGGLKQSKARGKRTAPPSETMAMGQKVLQTLASQAEAGTGRSQNEQSKESGGLDFSRLLSQMMPVVSQALGTVGSADRDAPHQSSPGDSVSQADVKAVLEHLVNGDALGGVFRSMVESAVKLMDEDGNSGGLEALGEDDEILDGFLKMMKKTRRDGDGSGDAGS